MSETVYHRGYLIKVNTPVNKTLNEFVIDLLKNRNKSVPNGETPINFLGENFSEEFFYYKKTKTLYKIEDTKIDLDEDLIEAKIVNDHTIEYDLKFYNGGTGLEECLEESLDKLDL